MQPVITAGDMHTQNISNSKFYWAPLERKSLREKVQRCLKPRSWNEMGVAPIPASTLWAVWHWAHLHFPILNMDIEIPSPSPAEMGKIKWDCEHTSPMPGTKESLANVTPVTSSIYCCFWYRAGRSHLKAYTTPQMEKLRHREGR